MDTHERSWGWARVWQCCISTSHKYHLQHHVSIVKGIDRKSGCWCAPLDFFLWPSVLKLPSNYSSCTELMRTSLFLWYNRGCDFHEFKWTAGVWYSPFFPIIYIWNLCSDRNEMCLRGREMSWNCCSVSRRRDDARTVATRWNLIVIIELCRTKGLSLTYLTSVVAVKMQCN
jgi:hypothetical protein